MCCVLVFIHLSKELLIDVYYSAVTPSLHMFCVDLTPNHLSPEGVTWGKVVSLYAVAGALAVDCVRHGHPAMVHTIVDCMGEFVRKSLTSWLRRRGGWVRRSLLSLISFTVTAG